MTDQTATPTTCNRSTDSSWTCFHSRLVSPVYPPVKAGFSVRSRLKPVESRFGRRSASPARSQGIAWADRKTVAGRVCAQHAILAACAV